MILDPKLSVLLAVYNADEYVGEAIKSILNQTFSDFEVIVVNDGSTDRSLQIIESFVDDRLVVIDQENRGLPASLNRAADLAKGVYLARMDADDICLPDRFLRQVGFLDQNEEITVVGSAVEYADAQGKSIARSFPTISTRFLMQQLTCGRCCLAHPTIMMRSSAFRKVGGYDESLGHLEDAVLWARMIRSGYTAANIPTPLLKYRISDTAISSMNEDEEFWAIREEVFANVERIPVELVVRFRQKYLELSQAVEKKTASRIRSVSSGIWYRIYSCLRLMGLGEYRCEKVVYKLRLMMDVLR